MAESADIEGSAAPTPPSPLERLVWEPPWRERLAGLVGGMPPLRLAAAAVASVAVVVLVAVAVLREPAPLPELTMPVAGGPGDPAATTTTATVEPVRWRTPHRPLTLGRSYSSSRRFSTSSGRNAA